MQTRSRPFLATLIVQALAAALGQPFLELDAGLYGFPVTRLGPDVFTGQGSRLAGSVLLDQTYDSIFQFTHSFITISTDIRGTI